MGRPQVQQLLYAVHFLLTWTCLAARKLRHAHLVGMQLM